MNWTKKIFILSLLNFLMITGLVSLSPIGATTTITLIPAPTTPVPITSKPVPAITPPTKTVTIDPLVGKCIVYIDSTRYDVTEFRNTHGGGDIFQCGTDMTDNFKSQHQDSYLSRMAKYKI